MLQKYIEKKYELRITIIGEDVFSVKIDSQHKDETKEDWRVNNCSNVNYSSIKIPDFIIQRCKNMLKQLDINFSSIDLIFGTDGDYYFLDLNPNGQWAWIDEKLNLHMSESIGAYFYGK